MNNLNYEIQQIEKAINDVMSNCEGSFLGFSSTLQKFASSVKNFLENITVLQEQFSNQNYPDLLSSLNENFTRVITFYEQLNNSSTQDIENIKFISQEIQKTGDLLIQFKSIVKSLKMLGIATRIESSRLTDESGGFNALADNVESLSSYIEQKSQNIQEKTKHLSEVFSHSLSIIEQSISNNLNTISNINQQKHIIENEINIKIENDKNTFQQLSNHYSLLKNQTNDIVVKIQFQDITKQRMEHILQSLYEISNEQNNYTNIYKTLELQIEQLYDISQTVDNAITGILQDLNKLYKVIELIAKIFQEFDSFGENQSNKNIFDYIKVIVNDVHQTFSKGSEESNELNSIITNIIENINELNKFIQQIEDTGEEIELIALNARVKAARVGSNGASLGVISEEVQKLSVDARNRINVVSGILTQVNNTTETLKEIVSEAAQQENMAIILNILNEINNNIESIEAIKKIFEDNINYNKQNINEMINMLKHQLLGFNKHIDIRNKINSIAVKLESLARDISKYIDPNEKIELDRHLKKYTMHSERKIYEKVTGEKVTDQGLGNNIELF